MNMCLTKFDIYQEQQKLLISFFFFFFFFFFEKIVLSDVRFEIHLDQRNATSTGKSIRA